MTELPNNGETDTVRTEIESILRVDTSRLGDVYRLSEDNLTAAEVAEKVGVATVGFVSNYRAVVAALLDGIVPTSPSMAGQIASRVRSWLRTQDISPVTKEYLENLQAKLQLYSEDVGARSSEDDKAREQTRLAEEKQVPGVYVYTLPHYLRYPFDPESGRTLMKVGRSERDVFRRVAGQGRTTALPEDPILLRVYKVLSGESARVEKDFHSWLDDADHDRSRTLRGGTEWFLTSLKFLDRIAKQWDLDNIVINNEQAGNL